MTVLPARHTLGLAAGPVLGPSRGEPFQSLDAAADQLMGDIQEGDVFRHELPRALSRFRGLSVTLVIADEQRAGKVQAEVTLRLK